MHMKLTILKTIIKRLRSKTPKFFKVIRNTSIAIALASGAVTMTYATFDESMKAVIPIEFIKMIGIAALTSTIVAQLTKDDNIKQDI